MIPCCEECLVLAACKSKEVIYCNILYEYTHVLDVGEEWADRWENIKQFFPICHMLEEE